MVPVEGVNVPEIDKGVPVPVNVRVLDPLAENIWDVSMVKDVNFAADARLSWLVPVLADI